MHFQKRHGEEVEAAGSRIIQVIAVRRLRLQSLNRCSRQVASPLTPKAEVNERLQLVTIDVRWDFESCAALAADGEVA
jgi:hypothetical protein